MKRQLLGILLYTIVDDLTIRAEGSESRVVSALALATQTCIEELEGSPDMQVSRGSSWTTLEDVKSVAVASTRGARQRLSTSMRALGIPTKRHTRILGVD